MEKIAYFGGSFDPPHTGHLGIGLAALNRADRVLFAPTYDPPHKPGRRRTSFADRLAMVRLLVKGHPGLEACDIEGMLKLSPSYTADVLAVLEHMYPAAGIALLIGGDSLRQLHTWKEAPRLAERYEILTYPRPGEELSREELLRNWPPETAEKLMAGCLKGDFFEISSTNLRKGLAKNGKMSHINKGITPEVAEYIRANHLYNQETE